MRWGALIVVVLALAGTTGRADPIRIATFHTELTRDGPGVLLADILDRDAQVVAVANVIAHIAPDIVHLAGFDHDLESHALGAFTKLLAELGHDYPYAYAPQPNTGVPSGVDLNGDGYDDGPEDAFGYGRFTGQGGMAVLSKRPLGAARSFSGFLWADLPDNLAPEAPGGPFPSAEARAVQRLSSVGHWVVPVDLGGREIDLMVWHGNTPVFDGPEDLNGRRGADEARFWRMFLDGDLPFDPPQRPVVLAGVSNIDPSDGDGWHDAMQALLDDPRLRDPQPVSAGGTEASNPEHKGNPALDTADFDDPEPGNLRVDYVLPDAGLTLVDSGVFWPLSADPMAKVVATASRHRLVWVDVLLP
ncbi:endonuclease/exonuclease/phosphatase family protein [Maritimibacter dapengensis]|uniref:Endonuclease/exonuclease/phosphatase family protein n=1 Tax=Maritimibacter dapengensis TaxID=2836868 RepID=A0ABS6T6C4_9RHOB|nr:endonuclease/exonuclease/phosphatase family protein [Maritimibacter dapengensis]MBV7379892.1 endonuclease/exonuclease/phosphatase family protein [Maritimibacter dapengensis]